MAEYDDGADGAVAPPGQDARGGCPEEERFDFLGYRVGWRRQQLLLDVRPNSLVRIRERLRQPTTWSFLCVQDLVTKLNRYIGGASAYFRLAPWWSLRRIDSYMQLRMAKWWRRKLGLKYPPWSRVAERKLHTEHGLLSCAGTPLWGKARYVSTQVEIDRSAGCGKSARPVG